MTTKFKAQVLGCLASASLAVLVGIGSAGAATMSFLGGAAGTLPADFTPNGGPWPNADGVGVGSDIRIYTSASPLGHGLYVAPQNVQLTFTLVGFDAGNNNSADSQFTWNNTALFSNSSGLGATHTANYDVGGNPGLLPFIFQTNGSVAGVPGASAANGGPISPSVKLAFSDIFGGAGTQWVYAFFEDVVPGDSDFDDMIVKITAFSPGGGNENTVPLPPALVLFGSALVGLTLLGRRRRQNNRNDSVAAA